MQMKTAYIIIPMDISIIFDSVSNSIVVHKTKGYNSCKNPEVQGKEYSGNAGEMILEVIVKDGTISVQWTGGKQ